ncbi:MAG: aconitate hydratase, partial [Thermodesulfobacteriota bacterium]|nr:aconitate hydratase [Thermodesulfobacteriota bacterium]
IYLVSPETAAASALRGVITDPRRLGDPIRINLPDKFLVNDDMIIVPPAEREGIEIVCGPNIKPLPTFDALPEELDGDAIIILGDNITTDDILPGGAEILPLRSNLPAISRYLFSRIESDFLYMAEERGGGFILGGKNYGQGSSREHAALAIRFKGVRVVVAESFARIHKANLINFGVLPLEFKNEDDIGRFSLGDRLRLNNLISNIRNGKPLPLENLTKGFTIETVLNITPRLHNILIAGGLLAYIRFGENKQRINV